MVHSLFSSQCVCSLYYLKIFFSFQKFRCLGSIRIKTQNPLYLDKPTLHRVWLLYFCLHNYCHHYEEVGCHTVCFSAVRLHHKSHCKPSMGSSDSTYHKWVHCQQLNKVRREHLYYQIYI